MPAHEMTRRPTRLIMASEIRCPAGEICGKGVRCRVEQNTLDAYLDPTTLETFCLGGYTECSSWRAEKARIEEQRTAPLVQRPARVTV